MPPPAILTRSQPGCRPSSVRSRFQRAVGVLVPATLIVVGVLNVLPSTDLASKAPIHNRPLHFQRGADLVDLSISHGAGAVVGRYAPYLVFGSVFDEPIITAQSDHGIDRGLVVGLTRGQLVVEEYDDQLTAARAEQLRAQPHFEGLREDGRYYVVVEPGASGRDPSRIRVMEHGDTLFIATEHTFTQGPSG